MERIDGANICVGNPDSKFIAVKERKKGVFRDRFGNFNQCIVYFFLNPYFARPKGCLSCREQKRSPEGIFSHTNYRFLNTPEKDARLRRLHRTNRILKGRVRRLESKLAKTIETESIVVDDETSNDLERIMKEEERNVIKGYPDDSFQAIFGNQQKLALPKKGKSKNGMKWHPLMIRFCLYLRHQSSKAYEALRDSGCIMLPSQRTLRDYSNAVKADAGFSVEVDEQVLLAAN